LIRGLAVVVNLCFKVHSWTSFMFMTLLVVFIVYFNNSKKV